MSKASLKVAKIKDLERTCAKIFDLAYRNHLAAGKRILPLIIAVFSISSDSMDAIKKRAKVNV